MQLEDMPDLKSGFCGFESRHRYKGGTMTAKIIPMLKYRQLVWRFEQYGIVHFCHVTKLLRWRLHALRIPYCRSLSDVHLQAYWDEKLGTLQTPVTVQEIVSFSGGLGALRLFVRKGETEATEELIDDLYDQMQKLLCRIENPYTLAKSMRTTNFVEISA